MSAFTGRTRTAFEAGFAGKVVGSLVKGLMPWRAGRAAFFTTTYFVEFSFYLRTTLAERILIGNFCI